MRKSPDDTVYVRLFGLVLTPPSPNWVAEARTMYCAGGRGSGKPGVMQVAHLWKANRVPPLTGQSCVASFSSDCDGPRTAGVVFILQLCVSTPWTELS